MKPTQEFVLTRTFDSPRESVFKTWTEPAHLSHWWGPSSMTISVCEMSVKPGGAYRIVMRSAEGKDYPMTGVYREILPPELLVMTMDCSEHPPEWHDGVKSNRRKDESNPAGEMRLRVDFKAIDDQTKLTIRVHFESVAIHDALLKMGMAEGWSQSMDRLEAELVKMD